MIRLDPLKNRLKRKTGVFVRPGNRELIAEIGAEGVYIRRERSRSTAAYFISWMMIHDLGAKRRAAEIKAERIARRKARKAA